MAQELITTSSLIKWCDDLVAEGKELKLCWEGGGDSGWVTFRIDDDHIEEDFDNKGTHPEVDTLINMMYDHLDYGSWAGEFSANGEAIYDPELKAFVGTDYYSEDDTHYQECEIRIAVPKNLWFDALEYNMEGEEPNIDVAFIIRNGFLTEEHDKVVEELQERIEFDANEAISAYLRSPEAIEFRSVWQNDRINRSDFKEEDDYLVYTIAELNIGIYNTSDKDVCLQLTADDNE